MNFNFIHHIAMSTIAQIINCVCLVIFTKALMASSRFRLQNATTLPQSANILKSSDSTRTPIIPQLSSCSGGDEASRNIYGQDSGMIHISVNNLTKKDCNNHSPINIEMETRAKSKNTNKNRIRAVEYSRKEMQIIKVVTLTSAIFVCSNFPTTCLSITHLVIPGFGRLGEYQISYGVTIAIQKFCEYLNTDLNFFVYHRCNSKFKDAFYSTFKSRCGQSSHGC